MRKQKELEVLTLFVSVIMSWLETADGFQTFDQKTEAELEQEIQEVRALLTEEDEEEPQC